MDLILEYDKIIRYAKLKVEENYKHIFTTTKNPPRAILNIRSAVASA